MRCYFHGSVIKNAGSVGKASIVSFAIPDIGVAFRSRWSGTLLECQYVALLMLLKFVDTNPGVFKDRSIEVFSDSSVLISQLVRGMHIYKSIEPYHRMARSYRSKIPYRVHWLPEDTNPACIGLAETPPMKPGVKINFDIKGKARSLGRQGDFLPTQFLLD